MPSLRSTSTIPPPCLPVAPTTAIIFLLIMLGSSMRISRTKYGVRLAHLEAPFITVEGARGCPRWGQQLSTGNGDYKDEGLTKGFPSNPGHRHDAYNDVDSGTAYVTAVEG